MKNAETTPLKTGSYAIHQGTHSKNRSLRGVNVKIFQHELASNMWMCHPKATFCVTPQSGTMNNSGYSSCRSDLDCGHRCRVVDAVQFPSQQVFTVEGTARFPGDSARVIRAFNEGGTFVEQTHILLLK